MTRKLIDQHYILGYGAIISEALAWCSKQHPELRLEVATDFAAYCVFTAGHPHDYLGMLDVILESRFKEWELLCLMKESQSETTASNGNATPANNEVRSIHQA